MRTSRARSAWLGFVSLTFLGCSGGETYLGQTDTADEGPTDEGDASPETEEDAAPDDTGTAGVLRVLVLGTAHWPDWTWDPVDWTAARKT